MKPSSSRDTRKATLSNVSSRPATESVYYQTPATETEQNVVMRANEQPPSSMNLNDGHRSTGGTGEESVNEVASGGRSGQNRRSVVEDRVDIDDSGGGGNDAITEIPSLERDTGSADYEYAEPSEPNAW